MSITQKAPIRDKGIAIIGITTERIDPRKIKITTVTIKNASNKERMTSWMEELTNKLASYTIFPCKP